MDELDVTPAVPFATALRNAPLATEDAERRVRSEALWAAGQLAEALELATNLSQEESPAWAVDAASRRIEDQLDALGLFRSIESGDHVIESAALLSELAVQLDHDGYPLQALQVHERAVMLAPADAAIRRRRDYLAGSLHFALDVATQADLLALCPSYEPAGAGVVHLATASLPYVESPETQQLHDMARSQAAEGLQPAIVTLLPHPWDLMPADIPLKQEIDGIPYHRLLPVGPFPESPDMLARLNAEALTPLLQRLAPAVLQPQPDRQAGLIASWFGRALGLSVVYTREGLAQ